MHLDAGGAPKNGARNRPNLVRTLIHDFIIGVLVGARLAHRIRAPELRRFFAAFPWSVRLARGAHEALVLFRDCIFFNQPSGPAGRRNDEVGQGTASTPKKSGGRLTRAKVA